MKTISEIKEAIISAQTLAYAQGLHDQKYGTQQAGFEEYAKRESKAILLGIGIPLDRLEEICNAERAQRLAKEVTPTVK